LSEDEIALLDRGLSFIPSVKTFKLSSYRTYVDRLVRRVRLIDFFQDREDNYDPREFAYRFLAPSSWCPPAGVVSCSTKQTIDSILQGSNSIMANNLTSRGDALAVKFKPNLPDNELRALNALRSNVDIVIKSADKGGSIVVMEKTLYTAEALRQLNNPKYYKRIDESIATQNALSVNLIIDKLLENGHISQRQSEFLRCDPPIKNRYFYLLPKVHKQKNKWPHPQMPEGRPIVASCGSELSNIGKFIDYFLQPLVKMSEYYIKDTYHFISKVRGRSIQPDWYFITGDVSSLYTNMDHSLILSTLKSFFRRFPDNNRPETELLQLMELTLGGNDFSFDDQFYLQVLGMAMGNSCSPSTANLFLAQLDDKANSFTTSIRFYNRFLDDIFFLWPGTLEQFNEFDIFINSIIPNIRITFNVSLTSVNFLDITLFKHHTTDGCTIQTKPYFKSTDTHQLVHTKSFHPRHTFRGILKSQFIRLKRLSSFREDFLTASSIIKKVLITRGYSKRLLRTVQNDVWLNFRETDHTSTSPNSTLPLIVKYNTVGTYSARIWRNILNENPLFNHLRIITAYSVHNNLGKLLCKNATKNLIHQPTGCHKCVWPRCKACNYITESINFVSNHTHKSYLVRNCITCTTNNIVYLITCNLCGLQYVGETGRMLKARINDHLSAIRLNKPTPIGIHFNQPSHSTSNFSIIGIEANLNSITERRSRESLWQNTLKT
jgi:hypothetical protein